MKMTKFLILVCLFAGVALNVHAQPAKPAGPAVMAAGLWEITTQTLSPIPGLPLTHQVCIDRALVAPPETPKDKPSDDCKVQQGTRGSNEMAYSVRCAKRGIVSSWHFTYFGDRFEGTGTINSSDGEVHQTFRGKRIGGCDDVPPPQATSTAQ